MKTKKREVFERWEAVMLAQIRSNQSAINCLLAEAAATIELLDCQTTMLDEARKDEARELNSTKQQTKGNK